MLSCLGIDAVENLPGRLQLNQNPGGFPCTRGIVNLARHSVSLFGDGGFACLLCKTGELQSQSCLLRQSLREFQFHRAELAQLRKADDDRADCFVRKNQRNTQQRLNAFFAQIGFGCLIERLACSSSLPHRGVRGETRRRRINPDATDPRSGRKRGVGGLSSAVSI